MAYWPQCRWSGATPVTCWCLTPAPRRPMSPESGELSKPLEAAQDPGERPHRGKPPTKAPLQRTDIGHDDIARPLIPPLCGLVDHLVGSAAQEHLPHDGSRHLARVGQGRLFVE